MGLLSFLFFILPPWAQVMVFQHINIELWDYLTANRVSHFLFCVSPLFESRVHCFHYLIPLTKQGNYAIVANVESMDYDPLVVKLNKDISAIEEAMGAALQQHKFQYIFEGEHLEWSINCISQLLEKNHCLIFLKWKFISVTWIHRAESVLSLVPHLLASFY